VSRRPRRGIPATLTALVLLAASVLTAIDAIQLLAKTHPLISYARATGELHKLHWNGPVPAITAGVLIALGLLVLLAALVPGRPVVVALTELTQTSDDPGTTKGLDAGVSRRGLRTMLGTAAASVDGVASATLTVRRNVVAATVRTLGSSEGMADTVRAALEQRLDQVSPAQRPALRVRATTSRSAS
jgi:hypothetical protein